jgi:hypothetical protein
VGGIADAIFETTAAEMTFCLHMPDNRLGEGAVIRAGACVVRDIPPRAWQSGFRHACCLMCERRQTHRTG